MEFEHQSEKFACIDLEALAGVQSALAVLGSEIGKRDGIDGLNICGPVNRFREVAEIAIRGVLHSCGGVRDGLDVIETADGARECYEQATT